MRGEVRKYLKAREKAPIPSSGSNQGPVKVGYVAQKLRNSSNISRIQLRIQRFRQNSTQTPNEPETDVRRLLCCFFELAELNQAWVEGTELGGVELAHRVDSAWVDSLLAAVARPGELTQSSGLGQLKNRVRVEFLIGFGNLTRSPVEPRLWQLKPTTC